MQAGKRHGQGIFYYIDGRVYKGTWIEDQIQGYGTEEGPVYYEGEWVKGKWHGKGLLKFK